MNLKIYLLSFIIAISSCKEGTKVTASDQKDSASGEHFTADSSVVMKQHRSTVLLRNEVKHVFSDTKNTDLFQLILSGDSLLSGTVHFNIISHRGDTLHTESFPATYLIGYELDWESATAAAKEAVIKRRMNEFFAEKNFLQPAIKPGEKYNADWSDKTNWNDIRADQSAVGFQYLVGEEDTKRIAYSKKKKKVVIYFNCC